MLGLSLLACIAAIALGASPRASRDDDPYLWLEEVEGAKALDWVRAQNARSLCSKPCPRSRPSNGMRSPS